MTHREKLQFSYELAFFPPRLNQVWYQIKHNAVADTEELGRMLDTALQLHGALPAEGFASQRALNRLALYQAKSRAFHTVSFLRKLRERLGRAPLPLTEVPAGMVRDIGLPPLSRASRGPVSGTVTPLPPT